MDPKALEEVIAELAPLAGGRIQRIDLVAKNELVLELRYPGRTLRLLVSGRPGMGRVHLVDARPPKETAGGDMQRLLRKRFEGRPLVALEADRHAVIIDGRDARLSVRTDGGKPVFEWSIPSGREIPSFGELPPSFPKSEAIAGRYQARAPEEAAAVLRRELLKRAQSKRKKLEKLRANLARDLERLAEMEANRKLGELLKPELSKIARGAKDARVTDWETGAELSIPLDPALSARANMERWFVRAKKAERGQPIVAKRLAQIEQQLGELDAMREQIASADLESLLSMSEEGERVREPREAPSAEAKKPIDRWSRKFTSADGTEIRVGKGAKENDRLTLSVAKGDDVWLHASGTQGAHVLIRLAKGTKPSPETLLDAAHLAAHYSGAKNDSKVEVIYTDARHVKKTKGDPPGRVSVAKGRTILVAMDPARIARLFGRELTPKGGD